jgi:hypothetical protein
MQANAYSKYALRDLHEAIDLFDRKIDYCQTTERFESAQERAKTLQKLCSKREAMVKTALALSALGVETDNAFLPRSFKPVVADIPGAVVEAVATAPVKRRRAART